MDKRHRILVVDDDADMCELLSDVLEAEGLSVLTVVDSSEAAKILKQEEFDVIITDLNMPNLDGIQLITAVRKLPGCSFVPILMLTTESQVEKKDAGRKAGATGWIVKPFNADQLIAVVQKLVK